MDPPPLQAPPPRTIAPMPHLNLAALMHHEPRKFPTAPAMAAALAAAWRRQERLRPRQNGGRRPRGHEARRGVRRGHARGWARGRVRSRPWLRCGRGEGRRSHLLRLLQGSGGGPAKGVEPGPPLRKLLCFKGPTRAGHSGGSLAARGQLGGCRRGLLCCPGSVEPSCCGCCGGGGGRAEGLGAGAGAWAPGRTHQGPAARQMLPYCCGCCGCCGGIGVGPP